jgi:hypothetical protein
MTAVATPARPRRRTHPARTLAVPLGLIAVAFLAYALPPYLGLDPAQARLAQPVGTPWFYPALVAHIGFGAIALLAATLQVWPWLRRAHPVVHRWSGRTYVFLGVVPASIAAIGVAPFSVAGGPAAHLANSLLDVLWFGTTVAGYRAARAGRYAEHREWMIRSVALAFSIIANRIWTVVCILLFAPSVFGDGPVVAAELHQAVGAAAWLSWVLNLLLAELWLQRTRRRAVRPALSS